MRGKRVIDKRAHPFQNEKRAALFFWYVLQFRD